MKSLVVVNSCIALFHILIWVNPTTAVALGPGDSACRYSGNFDSGNEICHEDVVKIDALPEECSSFVFDGVICDNDYQIVYRWIPEDIDHLQSLIDFDDGEKHVYLFYKHRTLEDWSNALYVGDFQKVAQAVNDFIAIHAVKGLILDGMDDPVLPKNGCGDFHKNFTAYVTAIKTKNPGLEIGFYLSARLFIINSNVGINSTWYDFCMMNDLLDFYVFEFATFNECCDEFLHGGVTPLDSSNPDAMTLNKFAAALNQSTIDKEKVYFEFLISPVPKPEQIENFKHCELSYNEYCENHESYQGIWCVDNQDSMFKKGKFAFLYSKGFIGRDIDLVDRDNNCDCDNKYITFYMLLNGYMDATDPLTCKAFEI